MIGLVTSDALGERGGLAMEENYTLVLVRDDGYRVHEMTIMNAIPMAFAEKLITKTLSGFDGNFFLKQFGRETHFWNRDDEEWEPI